MGHVPRNNLLKRVIQGDSLRNHIENSKHSKDKLLITIKDWKCNDKEF